MVPVQQKLMDIASLIKEMSEKRTCIDDFIHFNNKVILCSENNGVKYTSEDALKNIDEQIKMNVEATLCKSSVWSILHCTVSYREY
jgi:hypothetical protein